MIHSTNNWDSVATLAAHNYTCGFHSCGREVSSEHGWLHRPNSQSRPDGMILVCPNCKQPTFFDLAEGIQIPGFALGSEVAGLPNEIDALWAEIRSCTGDNAFTAAVLTGRTLLMHIAVAQGAQAGQSFVSYVDYLEANHYSPPKSKAWIDKIRSHANEAAHEIVIKTIGDAEEIVVFLEMLLKFIYEFPTRGAKKDKP